MADLGEGEPAGASVTLPRARPRRGKPGPQRALLGRVAPQVEGRMAVGGGGAEAALPGV